YSNLPRSGWRAFLKTSSLKLRALSPASRPSPTARQASISGTGVAVGVVGTVVPALRVEVSQRCVLLSTSVALARWPGMSTLAIRVTSGPRATNVKRRLDLIAALGPDSRPKGEL